MSTTMNGNTKTYRGRSLEEIVPQIREDLGPDAVIVRQRDGLTGGIGGFFQRRCVEVEARAGGPRIDIYDEDDARMPEPPAEPSDETVERPALVLDDAASFVPLEIADLESRVPELRDDAASREGLASPAMRTLIDQAQPFAEALDRAAREQAEDPRFEAEAIAEESAVLVGAVEGAAAAPVPAPAPAPTAEAPAPDHGAVPGHVHGAGSISPAHRGTHSGPAAPRADAGGVPPRHDPGEPRRGAVRGPASEPRVSTPALVTANRPPQEATELERELTERGLHPDLARMIVGECVTHLLPVSAPDSLRTVVRNAVSRRIRTSPGWGGRGRALAFVGAAGSGKTACAARLARAYALHSDVPALCLSLSPRDDGASLAAELEGSSVPLAMVESGDELRERVHGARSHAAVIVDTPSVSVVDSESVAALARELDEVGLYETHLVLPATLSAPAAREQLRSLAPLGASRVVLTRLGETDHPGPVLGVIIEQMLTLSYISAAPGLIEPAEPDELAGALLP